MARNREIPVERRRHRKANLFVPLVLKSVVTLVGFPKLFPLLMAPNAARNLLSKTTVLKTVPHRGPLIVAKPITAWVLKRILGCLVPCDPNNIARPE